MFYTTFPSPLGDIMVAGNQDGLCHIAFQKGDRPMVPPAQWLREPNRFQQVRDQLGAYFRGELTGFQLPLAPRGTGFQRKIWSLLENIPYGQVISYRALAGKAGNPKASRAVGNANGRNPLPIVIPCHRVIGSNGRLTGYAGGLFLKRELLSLERNTVGKPSCLL